MHANMTFYLLIYTNVSGNSVDFKICWVSSHGGHLSVELMKLINEIMFQYTVHTLEIFQISCISCYCGGLPVNKMSVIPHILKVSHVLFQMGRRCNTRWRTL